MGSAAFKNIYSRHGIAAESVRKKKIGALPKLFIKAAVKVYHHFYWHDRAGVSPVAIQAQNAA